MPETFSPPRVEQDWEDISSIASKPKNASSSSAAASTQLLEQFCVPKDIVKYQQQTNTYVQE